MSERARLVQWAQEQGEVGGVRTSVHQVTRMLREDGVEVEYVDTGSAARAARSVPRLWSRRTAHLFHITRLWRAQVMAPVFAVLPGPTVLVLHSGSTLTQMATMSPTGRRTLVRALRAYDQIWAVNDEIRSVLPDDLVSRTTVVCPWVEPLTSEVLDVPRLPHRLTVATNAGQAHYHASMAVEAVALVRETWPAAELHILAYGHDGDQLRVLRESVASLPWVDVDFDLPPAEVSRALAQSEVFLRPTAWDGDSVIVREALALGTRVVASDTCPRPEGVELAPLDPEELAAVILGGGRVSDGAGLGHDSIVTAARALMSDEAQGRRR